MTTMHIQNRTNGDQFYGVEECSNQMLNVWNQSHWFFTGTCIPNQPTPVLFFFLFGLPSRLAFLSNWYPLKSRFTYNLRRFPPIRGARLCIRTQVLTALRIFVFTPTIQKKILIAKRSSRGSVDELTSRNPPLFVSLANNVPRVHS